MKIDKIVIVCHKGDYWLTKISVASIRYWYPDRDIYIVKDLFGGDFNTNELQNNWNVKELILDKNKFGSPLSKLYLFILSGKERILLLDSDTMFAGNVLEKIESFKEDFIVCKEYADSPDSHWFNTTYYDYSKVKQIDTTYKFPYYAFNTGQIVLTSGIFTKTNFKELIDWDNIPKSIKPDIFALYDQGILNYLLPKYEQLEKITIASGDFLIWVTSRLDKEIELNATKIANRHGSPHIMHWAGTVHPDISKMPKSDVVHFYQNYYYSKVPFGSAKKLLLNSWKKLRYGRCSSIIKCLLGYIR